MHEASAAQNFRPLDMRACGRIGKVPALLPFLKNDCLILTEQKAVLANRDVMMMMKAARLV